MPSGNPGVPKTKAQRARIAASVAAYHAAAKSAIARLDDAADIDGAVRTMCDFVQNALLAVGEQASMVKGRIDDLEEQLSERGKSIERMTVNDLCVSEHAGLLSKSFVQAEFRRRAAEANSPRSLQRPSGNGHFSAGSVVSGWLPCGRAGCETGFDLSKANGSQFCPEHRGSEPRQFISPNFTAIDLDEALRDAEREHELTSQRAAAALSQLDQARAAIARYDAQRQESKRDDDSD